MNDRFEGANPPFGAGRTMPDGLLRLDEDRTFDAICFYLFVSVA